MNAEATNKPNEEHSDANAPRDILVRELCIGEVLKTNITDDDGLLLLAAGTEITQSFLTLLQRRGLRSVRCVKKEKGPQQSIKVSASGKGAESLETVSSKKLDNMVEDGEFTHNLMTSNKSGIESSLSLKNLKEEEAAGGILYKRTTDFYEEFSHDLLAGRQLDVAAANDLLLQFMENVNKDRSLGPLLVQYQQQQDEYLFNHGLNTAILAMTVAAHMGYGQTHVLHAGQGALFHDIGMLKVPESIRLAHRKLTQDEKFEIERHPVYTVDALERVAAISPTTLLASYQTHERIDGQGYPRRRHGMHIHPMSKIVAAADTYCAMTGPRPYREPMLPYEGMKYLLEEVKDGHLDGQVVRAMLDCMSVFPVGSLVRLSNDMPARVIRANMGAHTRPIVLPLDAQGREMDSEVDLSLTDQVRVAQAQSDQAA